VIDSSSDFKPDIDIVACHIICKGKILFLLRKDNKPQGNTYGVPAGKVGQGETPEQALKREVKEETSLDIEVNNLKFQKTFNVKYDNYNFKFHAYNLYLDDKPKIRINKDEHESYVWCTPKEALKLDLIQDEDNVLKDIFSLNQKHLI
jgi:8-oxo-dGTP diphosphatase